MLVAGYQSIDMLCIELSVKFDGGLSISVLKDKQLCKKNGRQKFKKLKFFKSCFSNPRPKSLGVPNKSQLVDARLIGKEKRVTNQVERE
jgi:hypothetical protein